MKELRGFLSRIGFDRRINWKNVEKQTLEPDQLAFELRERFLDMFEFGIVDSHTPLPDRNQSKKLFVPNVLGYTSRTRDHWRSLAQVLRSPTQFTKKDDATVHADVIRHQNPWKEKSYYFAHDLLEQCMRGLVPQISEFDKSNIRMFFHFFNTGILSVQYDYNSSPHTDDYSEIQSFGSHAYRAERQFLLNFIYSPVPLEASWFMSNKITGKGYWGCEAQETVEKSGFRLLPFEVDPERAIALLQERVHHWENVPDYDESTQEMADMFNTWSKSFEGRAKYIFYVVQLGTVKIGNVHYYVYSGAEDFQLKEKVMSKSTSKPLGQLRLVRQGN